MLRACAFRTAAAPTEPAPRARPTPPT